MCLVFAEKKVNVNSLEVHRKEDVTNVHKQLPTDQTSQKLHSPNNIENNQQASSNGKTKVSLKNKNGLSLTRVHCATC